MIGLESQTEALVSQRINDVETEQKGVTAVKNQSKIVTRSRAVQTQKTKRLLKDLRELKRMTEQWKSKVLGMF